VEADLVRVILVIISLETSLTNGSSHCSNDSQATGSHHDTIPSRAGTLGLFNPMELISDLCTLGHMMLLEPRSRQLYIFSGMRNETYLSDMHMFSLDTHEITQISSNYQEKGGPEAAFTQRATIDEELGEFYLYVLTDFSNSIIIDIFSIVFLVCRKTRSQQ
jgi:hypothetical protein